jgi:hypothetical protein
VSYALLAIIAGLALVGFATYLIYCAAVQLAIVRDEIAALRVDLRRLLQTDLPTDPNGLYEPFLARISGQLNSLQSAVESLNERGNSR